MKRPPARRSEAGAGPSGTGDSPAGAGSTMEAIAAAALELARRARTAGFPAVSQVLEVAALEAAAAATASRWPNES